MNKILNVPEDFVSETLEGILLASNQKLLSMDKDNRVIVSNYPGNIMQPGQAILIMNLCWTFPENFA